MVGDDDEDQTLMINLNTHTHTHTHTACSGALCNRGGTVWLRAPANHIPLSEHATYVRLLLAHPFRSLNIRTLYAK